MGYIDLKGIIWLRYWFGVSFPLSKGNFQQTFPLKVVLGVKAPRIADGQLDLSHDLETIVYILVGETRAYVILFVKALRMILVTFLHVS